LNNKVYRGCKQCSVLDNSRIDRMIMVQNL
jgi:hypothetical protein